LGPQRVIGTPADLSHTILDLLGIGHRAGTEHA